MAMFASMAILRIICIYYDNLLASHARASAVFAKKRKTFA